MNEQQIEQEIQSKGLNAPRLTPADIDSKIKSVNYFTADDGIVGRSYQNRETLFNPGVLSNLTFCVIVLENGFTVTGESACASPENFNEEIGREVAYNNAREKIWQLEGYLLKQRLYEQAQLSLEQQAANVDPAKINNFLQASGYDTEVRNGVVHANHESYGWQPFNTLEEASEFVSDN